MLLPLQRRGRALMLLFLPPALPQDSPQPPRTTLWALGRGVLGMDRTDGGEEGRSPEGRRGLPKSFVEFGEAGGMGEGRGLVKRAKAAERPGELCSPTLPALPVWLPSNPTPHQRGQ